MHRARQNARSRFKDPGAAIHGLQGYVQFLAHRTLGHFLREPLHYLQASDKFMHLARSEYVFKQGLKRLPPGSVRAQQLNELIPVFSGNFGVYISHGFYLVFIPAFMN